MYSRILLVGDLELKCIWNYFPVLPRKFWQSVENFLPRFLVTSLALPLAAIINPLFSCSRQKDLISFNRGGRGCLSGGWFFLSSPFLALCPHNWLVDKIACWGSLACWGWFSICSLFCFSLNTYYGNLLLLLKPFPLELTSSKTVRHDYCIA